MSNWPTAILFTMSATWLCLWIIRKLVFLVRLILTNKRAMPRQILPRNYEPEEKNRLI